MLLGTAEYNKAASSAYNSLNDAEREHLRESALARSNSGGEMMSICEIKRTAAKTFKKVSSLVRLH